MKKKRPDHKHLSDVLKDMVKSHKLEAGLNQQAIQKAWQTVMGDAIVKYTQRLVLKETTLYVQLTDAVLRQQLSMGLSQIITNLNEVPGAPLVEKLVLR